MQRLTAQDMRENFLVLYDKVANFAAPGYEDEEISLFLTKAQDQLVKRYYNYKGNKYKEGFEETEKRRKDLSELIRHSDIDCSSLNAGTQPGASTNGIFVDLPTDASGNNLVLYTLREEIAISNAQDTCYADGTIIEVKPVTHDEYTAGVRNPFKRPDITKAWRLDFSSDTNGPRRHELITDGSYRIATYKLRYLKIPTDIKVDTLGGNNIDCELNASMHQEIVDVAVRIAAGITDPATYQIKVNEEQQSE
jgi:hypothetical protein